MNLTNLKLKIQSLESELESIDFERVGFAKVLAKIELLTRLNRIRMNRIENG